MAIFFSSDHHFQHLKICELSKRPFSSMEEMNSALIANWNAKVTPDDTVYYLGDFAMGSRTNVPLFCKQLNGYKILCAGNHDRGRQFMLESGFDEVHKSLKIELNGKSIFLHHQPLPETEWSDCDLALCGHVHTSWAEIKENGKRIINVGVDVRGFAPVTLEELLN